MTIDYERSFEAFEKCIKIGINGLNKFPIFSPFLSLSIC